MSDGRRTEGRHGESSERRRAVGSHFLSVSCCLCSKKTEGAEEEGAEEEGGEVKVNMEV